MFTAVCTAFSTVAAPCTFRSSEILVFMWMVIEVFGRIRNNGACTCDDMKVGDEHLAGAADAGVGDRIERQRHRQVRIVEVGPRQRGDGDGLVGEQPRQGAAALLVIGAGVRRLAGDAAAGGGAVGLDLDAGVEVGEVLRRPAVRPLRAVDPDIADDLDRAGGGRRPSAPPDGPSCGGTSDPAGGGGGGGGRGAGAGARARRWRRPRARRKSRRPRARRDLLVRTASSQPRWPTALNDRSGAASTAELSEKQITARRE